MGNAENKTITNANFLYFFKNFEFIEEKQ